MNPDLRIGADLGRQPAKKTRVFAVDKDVHVTAKLALFVEHAVAEAGMLARDRLNNLRRGHAHIERKRELDHVAATGPSAQR